MRQIIYFLPVLFLLTGIPNIHAQEKHEKKEAFKENYNTRALVFDGKNFLQPWNNDSYEFSTFGVSPELEKLLTSFPESSVDFKKYEAINRTANITYWTGITLMILSITYINIPQLHPNYMLYSTVATGGLVSLIVGLVLQDKARVHLYRAVWKYNREVSLSESTERQSKTQSPETFIQIAGFGVKF